MKRLILRMNGAEELLFSSVDEVWSVLEKMLRKVAAAHGTRAEDVLRLLDLGADLKIKELRDYIVHAYWWEYSNVGVTRGRFNRRGNRELIQVVPEQLEADCARLTWYADALESAMDSGWMNVYLPREPGGSQRPSRSRIRD